MYNLCYYYVITLLTQTDLQYFLQVFKFKKLLAYGKFEINCTKM